MNHALFVEENGQGYVLVGMPRVRLAPDSFSAAHFESLKTAVTQIEVASELEWPSDKFVRAGPVPAVLRSRTRSLGDPSPGGLAVVSQDVVPVEAESGGRRFVRDSGVGPAEVVMLHPGLQLSRSDI